MKPKKKPLLPVDIKLPERVLLEDGVMFATLRTLDELEQFWSRVFAPTSAVIGALPKTTVSANRPSA
jgi:hypothetical protein